MRRRTVLTRAQVYALTELMVADEMARLRGEMRRHHSDFRYWDPTDWEKQLRHTWRGPLGMQRFWKIVRRGFAKGIIGVADLPTELSRLFTGSPKKRDSTRRRKRS